MKNIKHLLRIHAARLAVLLAVLAPTALVKGQTNTPGLPAGWSDTDIGSPGWRGLATYDNGLWTVTGGGADIWNAADQFNFASTNFTGDGVMIAQVTSLQNSDPGSGWAKAGLMFRNDSTAGSVNVNLVATPGHGVSFQWRSAADGQCSSTIAGGVTAPVWLKLARSGQKFTGYYSLDDTNWFQVGSQTVAMNGTVMAGLAVTAHNNEALNTATFTNFSVTSLPPGWSDADIGSPVLAGSATYVNGLWIVTGGGSDIWTAADQFNFASTSYGSDGSITAQVMSLQNTDPWSKAGLMFRNDSTAGSVNVSIVATFGNGVNFQWRSTAGGQSSSTIAGGVTAPVWLKLARSGQKFTGYYSLDDTNWFQVGSQTVAMNGTVMAGLAVSAHNNAALNTATFTNVSLPAMPYTCTTANGMIIIIGYAGPGGAVTIPDTINGLPVSTIGSGAFQNCASLTSVTIPASVTSLDGSAFSGCTSLAGVYFQGNAPTADATVFANDTATVYYLPGTTGWNAPTFDGLLAVLLNPPYLCTTANGAITIIGYTGSGGAVTIPDTINGLPVTTIGTNAFNGCASLTSIAIGNSVTNIGNQAFAMCISLTAITVDASNPDYSSVAGVLFNKSQTTLIQYPGGNSGSYTIPNGVTSIGTNAFNGCTGLTSVTIPASVTSIGNDAFYGCTSLTGVYFLGNAPNLGSSVFSTISGYDPATIYYCWEFTGWLPSTFGGLPLVLLGSTNYTTIDAGNHYAYGANLGWLDWRGDANHGAVIATNICSGYIYSANFGWINLGSGSPANGLYYQNNSASDFGVNVDGSGNLSGYAYGANLGWINFESTDAPQVDLATGKLSGSVWSANWGWISLSNAVASVQTAALQQSSPSVTAPILGGITFTGGGGGGGGFGFSFTNVSGASFTVWTSTDLTQPFSSWTKVGTVTEVPGVSYSQYQFMDPLAGNDVQRFYRVSSP